MKTVNSYLFKTPEPTLIDCGENSEASWQALEKGLNKEGLTIADIEKVIITHAHVDHIGMAGRIAKHSHAKIWVSDYVYDWAVNLEEMVNRRLVVIDDLANFTGLPEDSPFWEMFRSVFGRFKSAWLPIRKEDVVCFSVDGTIAIGEKEWQVIYTPGHCIHQTCFYQPQTKQLLSADMLLNITPTPVTDASLEPPYHRVRALPQMLDSYEKLLGIDIAIVYPGHYEPFNNAVEIIDYQVNRIHQRKEELLALIENGQHDFMFLMQALYQERLSPVAFPMMVGYLDLLVLENKIELRAVNGDKGFYLKEDVGV